MTLVELFAIIVSCFGIVMSIGPFVQSYKIYKRKSAKDVSLLMSSIFVVGTIFWTVYGILTHDWPIIISFAIGVFGWTSLVLLTIYYK